MLELLIFFIFTLGILIMYQGPGTRSMNMGYSSKPKTHYIHIDLARIPIRRLRALEKMFGYEYQIIEIQKELNERKRKK